VNNWIELCETWFGDKSQTRIKFVHEIITKLVAMRNFMFLPDKFKVDRIRI